MKLKENPFHPNTPVNDFDLFAGRAKELKVLVDFLFQAGHGNPRHMIVSGPRGIGKSSFINQIQSLTDDSQAILEKLGIEGAGEFGFRFAIIKHRSAQGQSVEDVIASLIQQMPRNSKIKNHVNKFLEKWRPALNLGIIQFEYQTQNTSEITADFIDVISDIWSELKNDHDGMVIIIDEIDTIAENTNIASFLKVTSEELVDTNLDRVALYLVGVTGAMDKLKEGHASIGRVFEPIGLSPMLPDESRDVISRALCSTDDNDITFSDSAIERIIEIASGFPAVIHLLCYYAYNLDADNLIDDNDLESALDEVVTRIKRDELGKMLRDAGAGDYRKIMMAMAKCDKTNVRLKYIGDQIGRPSNELSAYMNRLVNRKIIVRTDRALYRFAEPLLKLYIQKLDVLEPQLPFANNDE